MNFYTMHYFSHLEIDFSIIGKSAQNKGDACLNTYDKLTDNSFKLGEIDRLNFWHINFFTLDLQRLKIKQRGIG